MSQRTMHENSEKAQQFTAEVTETADFILAQLNAAGAAPFTQLMGLLAAARIRHQELKKASPTLPSAEAILKDIAA